MSDADLVLASSWSSDGEGTKRFPKVTARSRQTHDAGGPTSAAAMVGSPGEHSVVVHDEKTVASSNSRIQLALEVLLERDRVVVCGIPGAEDQGHVASTSFLEEFLERFRTLLQLPG
jgi:hypothetical protein